MKEQAKVWVEVVEQGDTNPCDCIPQPILLDAAEPAEEEDEDEKARDPLGLGEGIAKGGGPAAIVGYVLRAQGQLVGDSADVYKSVLKSKDAEIDRLDGRVVHLEGMVDRLHKEKLDDAITIADLKGQLASSDPMAGVLAAFAPSIGVVLPEILARFGLGGAPNPPAANGEAADPGADLEAVMAALAVILQTHPEAMTQERWERFRVGYAHMAEHAKSKGWPT